MKKLLTAAVLMVTAVSLSACVDGTATVVYNEEPSPLTTMTFDTSLPPETYSEYMATYSGESETSDDDERHYLRYGIQADTGVTAPEKVTADGESGSLSRDTAPPKTGGQGAVRDTAATSVTAVTTAPPESEESVTETCVTGTGTDPEPEVTAAAVTTLARPKADTVGGGKVSADTAPTSFVPETTSDTSESPES